MRIPLILDAKKDCSRHALQLSLIHISEVHTYRDLGDYYLNQSGMVQTVSYTHLDVYKRQPISLTQKTAQAYAPQVGNVPGLRAASVGREAENPQQTIKFVEFINIIR